MLRSFQSTDLEKEDQVLEVGRDYIPDGEMLLRNTIYGLFDAEGDDQDAFLLAEGAFWSIGELINNANKANNRWALLESALVQRVTAEDPSADREVVVEDVQSAIEHNQADVLKRYGLDNIDLTASILKLIEKHRTNSFALSERFHKKITLTLRVQKKSDQRILIVNVINNSPITVIDRERVEYNLERIKDDLIRAGAHPFEAAVNLYEKSADHAGGGFGAGLRSIILFLKAGYEPFDVDIVFSRLIQYRSAVKSTIFTIEIPIPTRKKAR
ncbi:MAG: hypothetical protein F9K24_05040 [Leptonema illini]|jgi:hypothetical protein|uniref:Uncharacterized protein n=1 Tax=Leptonema illini TaxID=183 RepID=A0A833H3R1_9LEPT|nr:MAG: hypothetical protein F9K24_05040 [Leptonema illini]PKL32117.1 MAG: hypothetical protein CVV45_14355 [Spirochaetae bacterium HGW-Spirochaetae-10]